MPTSTSSVSVMFFGTFNGVQMEDSSCIAGDYLFCVTTKDDPSFHREPWTAVYKTSLKTGITECLTPEVTHCVTPNDIDAFTPVAIDATKVAVATIHKTSKFTDTRQEVHYRHIEIFESTRP
ncbi:hypothetical protein PanWU01x14_262350 [Parasponia andersonii]|uniref:Uncharacterized protein n=1 Tax=Parasponia andersonii TaxID=3476 RepID=A0A2P5B873_PARAD|nr:hypothetical protein PanWU01x14_262350 [Parasponia andersonii]